MKKFNKKLQLNKDIIAKFEQNHIIGGAQTTGGPTCNPTIGNKSALLTDCIDIQSFSDAACNTVTAAWYCPSCI